MNMSKSDLMIKRSINNEVLVTRFNTYLEQQPDGCIEWTGYRTSKGYGMFNLYADKNPIPTAVRAHRFSYALHYGFDKLPPGTDTTQKRNVLHHKCENKACVNPVHLEVVTDRWNLGKVNDKNMF
jgi:hypothetical protein